MNSKAGFSLIEVLATLLVTMLLMITMTPFISQMLANWAIGGETAGIVELKTRGLGRLGEDLRHAIVWTGYGEAEELAAFEGDETSMRFPVASGHAGPAIEYVSYSVATALNGRAMIRRRAPIVGSAYGNLVDPVVLLSGPYRYVFRYYSRDGAEMSVWHKKRMELPARVELDVLDRNGAQLLGVPVAISTFSSSSGACFATGGLPGCPPAQISANEQNMLMSVLGLAPSH